MRDDKCLHKELGREVGSDFSDVAKGKAAHPRQRGDVFSTVWLVIRDNTQISSKFCGLCCMEDLFGKAGWAS